MRRSPRITRRVVEDTDLPTGHTTNLFDLNLLTDDDRHWIIKHKPYNKKDRQDLFDTIMNVSINNETMFSEGISWLRNNWPNETEKNPKSVCAAIYTLLNPQTRWTGPRAQIQQRKKDLIALYYFFHGVHLDFEMTVPDAFSILNVGCAGIGETPQDRVADAARQVAESDQSILTANHGGDNVYKFGITHEADDRLKKTMSKPYAGFAGIALAAMAINGNHEHAAFWSAQWLKPLVELFMLDWGEGFHARHFVGRGINEAFAFTEATPSGADNNNAAEARPDAIVTNDNGGGIGEAEPNAIANDDGDGIDGAETAHATSLYIMGGHFYKTTYKNSDGTPKAIILNIDSTTFYNDNIQQQWFVNEVNKAQSTGAWLIINSHHPITASGEKINGHDRKIYHAEKPVAGGVYENSSYNIALREKMIWLLGGSQDEENVNRGHGLAVFNQIDAFIGAHEHNLGVTRLNAPPPAADDGDGADTPHTEAGPVQIISGGGGSTPKALTNPDLVIDSKGNEQSKFFAQQHGFWEINIREEELTFTCTQVDTSRKPLDPASADETDETGSTSSLINVEDEEAETPKPTHQTIAVFTLTRGDADNVLTKQGTNKATLILRQRIENATKEYLKLAQEGRLEQNKLFASFWNWHGKTGIRRALKLYELSQNEGWTLEEVHQKADRILKGSKTLRRLFFEAGINTVKSTSPNTGTLNKMHYDRYNNENGAITALNLNKPHTLLRIKITFDAYLSDLNVGGIEIDTTNFRRRIAIYNKLIHKLHEEQLRNPTKAFFLVNAILTHEAFGVELSSKLMDAVYSTNEAGLKNYNADWLNQYVIQDKSKLHTANYLIHKAIDDQITNMQGAEDDIERATNTVLKVITGLSGGTEEAPQDKRARRASFEYLDDTTKGELAPGTTGISRAYGLFLNPDYETRTQVHFSSSTALRAKLEVEVEGIRNDQDLFAHLTAPAPAA